MHRREKRTAGLEVIYLVIPVLGFGQYRVMNSVRSCATETPRPGRIPGWTVSLVGREKRPGQNAKRRRGMLRQPSILVDTTMLCYADSYQELFL
jgi:hypothetical protein